MMDLRPFYTTLPSDSSMKYYPDNTVACFTTKLPKEISLDGKWEVGLSEISFPLSFLTINETTRLLSFKEYHWRITGPCGGDNFFFEPGLFSDLQSFVNCINEQTEAKGATMNVLDNDYIEITNIVDPGKPHDSCNDEYGYVFPENFRKILGFTEKKVWIDFNQKQSLVSPFPGNINAALPDSVYVYSNICEASVIGDTCATILRVIRINYSKKRFGDTYHVNISHVNYIPLLSNSFRDIEIDLRDRLGQPLPFVTGPSCVTLHFRRID